MTDIAVEAFDLNGGSSLTAPPKGTGDITNYFKVYSFALSSLTAPPKGTGDLRVPRFGQ